MANVVPSARAGRTVACALLNLILIISAASPAVAAPSPPPAPAAEAPLAAPMAADVVVYGGTPGGVLAAVTAARAGADVLLIEPSRHVGGMVSNGLTATDYGATSTIGGYTREFFDRTQAIEGTAYGRYRFQPSTAETAFTAMLASADVTTVFGERLAQGGGAVVKNGTRIASARMESGTVVSGGVFIDASYEGDLMAAAGVSHRIGRESQSEYNESLAGVRRAEPKYTPPAGTELGFPVTPAPGTVGSGDNRVMSANYRLCFSTTADRIRFRRPSDYDPARFDVIAEYLESHVQAGRTPLLTWFLWPVLLSNGKFDVNNNSGLSIGVYGNHYGYAGATYAQRQEMRDWTRSYTEGFLYFLANDDRVPDGLRREINLYGLCADEFVDNQNWPRQLYLREIRRMVGAYVVTQRDVETTRIKSDTVAIASYPLDSHHVSRWVNGAGTIVLEGGFWQKRANATRWSVPYRSLTPLANEATNLLVPVAASASHVAWASLRMEPQFMLMGEAAGQAAAMSHAAGVTVQSLNVGALQAALRAHGSVVDNPLFTDIAGSPFRGDIERTFLAGMVIGCSATAYCPTTAMSREVMAAFLHRTLKLGPASRDYFTDDAASPHQDSINRLAEAGLTRGCTATQFCPTATMTRGQMAAFLVRSFRLPPTSRDYFTDDNNSIFENDINKLAASGVTGGCGGTKFCPTRLVTRGEMAAFLWRATRL